MNSSPHTFGPQAPMPPPEGRVCWWAPQPRPASAGRRNPWLAFFATVLLLLGITPAARAQQSPPGCTGSGLGISLFTSAPDVHIGDTIKYSISVFNGAPGSGRIVCDAIDIVAGIVTPDGRTNYVTLVRRVLLNGESDFYPDVVSYVVRAEDVRSDATVRATAFDEGTILQNDTPSRGGSDQGVNTEVSLPCIQIGVVCVGSIGENGAISFTGSVTNCGNNVLVGVGITNFVNGTAIPVTVINQLARGQVATFSGSWIPSDPCTPSTARFEARGTDQFTVNPRTVTASASTTCQNALSPSIRVTKACPVGPVAPGQLLVYSGTVTNTGNVTLRNVTVVGDHAGNPTVFSVASLAPGAGASFTGSYAAPVDCSTSSGVVARGTSVCGTVVSDSAASTCPVVTMPLIAVTTECASTIAVPGGVQTYTGTVRNTGNIALKNVAVRSDRPAANTVIFTVASLAPGASANFTGTYTVPSQDACAVTTTVVASGQDVCTDASVTATSAVTCGVTTAPLLAVTLDCPAVPVATGASITLTGTVRNAGNVALNNVTVVNPQASAGTVFTVASLAPGATASFTASFATPADACSVISTVTATGRDSCTSLMVSATNSATCTLVTTPQIVVTQDCPTVPVGAGGLFTYTGTVRNSGNVTLKNVSVTDDRNGFTAPGTSTIWFDDSLPDGAREYVSGGDVWNFVGSDPSPFTGSRAHRSSIGTGVHQHYFDSARETFAVGFGDVLVAHVYLDPANMPQQVMLQWYDGSWSHRAYWGANLFEYGRDGTSSRRYMGPLPAGGQWVRLEVPASQVGLENTVLTGMAFTLYGGRATWDAAGKVSGASNPAQVFTVASLAPGQTVAFTGSYTLPSAGACSVTTTLVAAAADNCSGRVVNATVTSTCPLVTTPAIEVTQTCPPTPGVQGNLLNFSGVVRNTGNITLTNVVVINNRSGSTPVLVLASLAPGATANFTGSYRVPVDCCVVSSTSTATGADTCTGRLVTDTATSTCPVLTSPQVAVTKICPAAPVGPGDRLNYRGTVSNTGNITLTDVFVVNNRSGVEAPLIGPFTLAPGESADFTGSYIYQADFCGTDTVTATGISVCDVSVSNSVTTTCPTVPTLPGIEVTKNCPVVPPRLGDRYTYTGTVRNTGNVTLTDVVVVDGFDCCGPNDVRIFGPITLAPGASADFSATFTAPLDCCEITDTISAAGNDLCSGVRVTDRTSTVCPILTTPRIAVAEVCPTSPVPVGGLYRFTGSVTNVGDVNLTNVMVFSVRTGGIRERVLGPVELAPGEVAPFSGSYTVAAGGNPSSDVIEATGMDTCQARTVTARANCSGPIAGPGSSPVITSVTVAEGVATISWQAAEGVTYLLQCKNIFHDPAWIDIPGHVKGSGSTATKTDVVGPTRHRFYRVLVVD